MTEKRFVMYGNTVYEMINNNKIEREEKVMNEQVNNLNMQSPEVETAISNGTSPKYLLMENVDALVSKRFKPIFEALIEWFDEHNYNTYWQILNAKDHGVPQNRKRVFALHVRKDVDNGRFKFPIPYDSGIRLRDILDENVDEKYYLSKGVSERFHSVENKGQNIIGSTAPRSGQ